MRIPFEENEKWRARRCGGELVAEGGLAVHRPLRRLNQVSVRSEPMTFTILLCAAAMPPRLAPMHQHVVALGIAIADSMGDGGARTMTMESRGENVDEQSAASFPCSDPPGYTMSTIGPPHRPEAVSEGHQMIHRPWLTHRHVAIAQGIAFAAGGLWPVLHLRSFERITGRKREPWLVKTVGLLLGSIGVSLLEAARIGRYLHVKPIATRSALALLAIDIAYASRKRISPVYLLDAAMQLAFLAGWGVVSRKHREPLEIIEDEKP